MQKGGVGRRATSSYFGTVGDPIGRCRSSDRYRARNTQSVRCKTYGTSAHSSGQARPQTAHSNSRRQNGVETRKRKPNDFIVLSQVVGEVDLGRTSKMQIDQDRPQTVVDKFRDMRPLARVSCKWLGASSMARVISTRAPGRSTLSKFCRASFW